jgi:5-methylthioadenosine/S-adenosylhomocysteine deaminase
MPERIDALICPRWTVAIEPEVRAVEGLALAVDAGRIKALLPRADAQARFAPDALHERPEHVLMPGLINAHCHAGMTLLRGFADDLPLEQWLHERIWPAEARWVSAQSARDGTRLAIAEMLRAGTTCFSDMYYFPDVVAEVASEAGMRVVVGMIAIEIPTVWAATPDEYISKGLAVRDRFKGNSLVATTFAPHAPYSSSDSTLARIRQLADELEVPIHTHLHETRAEVEEALAATGRRPLARLESLGLVTPALIGVHATQLLDAEIEALARAGASIVHCPRSNLKLASGVCPVAALLSAGVNVALGTDGAASNNRLDMWSELDAAALLGKWIAADASAVPAAAALRMATINGARALGLDSEIGSLEPGKAADLICVSMSDAALQPVLDPVSHLVYSASREHVSDVWIAGEHLLAEGQHTRLDVAEVCAAAGQWGRRIAGDLEPRLAHGE